MIFGFSDVVAASAVNALRFQNMAAKPLRNVVKFLRSAAGQELTRELVPLGGQQQREPRVLLVTEKGVVVDTTPAELMKKEKAAAVYCLDAQYLVSELWLASTQAFMLLDFQEPRPSGRVPRRSTERRKPARAQRKDESATDTAQDLRAGKRVRRKSSHAAAKRATVQLKRKAAETSHGGNRGRAR
jgi:hypothetical protein